MSSQKKKLLFLCVANSSRSQMAEGLARSIAPEGTEVCSAGSEPTVVNPMAVRAMQEIGIDISSHSSKSVSDVSLGDIGTVVTLCAEEVCPVFPGEVKREHWGLPDPAAAQGTEEEVLRAFRKVRDEIRRRLEEYFGAGSSRLSV